MNIQSASYPTIVPATFYDWVKKHFNNPNEEPIKETTFDKRAKAPNLRLKKYNYVFDYELLKAKKRQRQVLRAVENVTNAFKGVEIAVSQMVQSKSFQDLAKRMKWN